MNSTLEVHKKSVAVFAAITFGFSWLLFLPNVLATEALVTVPLLLTRILAGFGPVLAALVTIWLSDGTDAVKDFMRQIVSFKVKAKWITAAVIMPVIIAAIPIGILIYRHSISLSVITMYGWLMLIPNFILTLLLFGSVADELGWRGFLLPRLQKYYSAAVSSIIIGVFWALWQLPTYYFSGVAEANLSPIWLFLEVISLSVILTWMYNSSKSMVAVILFNAVYRTLMQFLLPVIQVSNHTLHYQQLYTTVLVNVALILLLFCGGKTLVYSYIPRKSSN